MKYLIDMVHRHGLVTLLVVLWTLALVSWVVWRVFSAEPPDIPLGTVTALGTVFGLPAIAVGLWKWRNGGD